MDEGYQGNGYEISVRTEYGRVLVHLTRAACEALGRGEESCLSAIANNGDIIGVIVNELVTDPTQMRVQIDGGDVLRFFASRH